MSESTESTRPTDRCLKAFYGARESSRKNTVKSLVSPGERPQEIYTPQCIVDALHRVWPHIALDPCSGPGSIVQALDTYHVPMRYRQTKSGKLRPYYEASGDEVDGLVADWVDYTYANPPYRELQKWLKKAELEGERGLEIAMLAPTRGNRTWFRDACRRATSVIELDPLTFLGFKSAFPAPLCMLYWGASKSTFEFAFEALGDAR